MHVAAAFRKPCCVLLGPYVTSATEHATQWGYPETLNLGKEQNHPEIFTPGEVYEALRVLLDLP